MGESFKVNHPLYVTKKMENRIFFIFFLSCFFDNVLTQGSNGTGIQCEKPNYEYCSLRGVCLSKDKCLYNNNQKTKFGIFENCPAGYSRCSEDKNETPCWKNDCEFCRCSSLVKNCSSQCVSSNFTIFMEDCIAKIK